MVPTYSVVLSFAQGCQTYTDSLIIVAYSCRFYHLDFTQNIYIKFYTTLQFTLEANRPTYLSEHASPCTACILYSIASTKSRKTWILTHLALTGRQPQCIAPFNSFDAILEGISLSFTGELHRSAG